MSTSRLPSRRVEGAAAALVRVVRRSRPVDVFGQARRDAGRRSVQGSRRLVVDRGRWPVTAYTGKCEMGQGLYTAQTQLVAEELCVPMTRVQADSMRDRHDARPGRHVGRAIASAEFQPRESRAGRRDSARGADADGVEALGVPVDQLTAATASCAHRTTPR